MNADGFLGHWTMTWNAKTGAKIWLDGRPMFAVVCSLEDCRAQNEESPNWRQAAEEVVKRLNAEPLGVSELRSCLRRLRDAADAAVSFDDRPEHEELARAIEAADNALGEKEVRS